MLLAKRPGKCAAPQSGETLIGHTKAVCDAFIAMFGTRTAPSRLGMQWMHFFDIPTDEWGSFWLCALLACLFHDLGKANSGFQEMLEKSGRQVIRHEHLSALLLCLPELRAWVEAQGVDFGLLLSAVLCHHLKVERNSADFAAPLNPGLDTFNVDVEGLREVLLLAPAYYGTSLPVFEIPKYWNTMQLVDDGVGPEATLYADAKAILRLLHKRLRKDLPRQHLLQAVRSALIVADSAGSGLLREDKPLQEWLNTAFCGAELLDDYAVERMVIEPRIRQLEQRTIQPFHWKDFQLAADTLPSRTLLLASCGSGKTLTAWRWITAQLRTHEKSRVLFLYPTRATATEGFRDYVSWAPEADAALISGTAAYELTRMFDNPDETDKGKRDYTTDKRLFAVGYWQKRIFSSTVHQFLGFMQHAYASTCLLPVLADSIVVFDEVHSFDTGLFSALCLFLKRFHIPALCMTATLPPERCRKLEQECGLTRFPEDSRQFAELQALAERPRYWVTLLEDVDAAEAIALEALDQGEKVLWVVNTVDRCQALAQRLDALCYHSRFRLQDRQSRHKEVVSAFGRGGRAVIAVTTQVCEMSLDLDADVLISEWAPIPSLVQRMGRCNRHLLREFGRIYCYNAPDAAPYESKELEAAERFLEALAEGPASQNRLAELLETYADNAAEVEKYSAFLSSAPWASSREEQLSGDANLSLQAILESDLEMFYQLRRDKKPFDGLVLPVPKYPLELRTPVKPSGLPVYLHLARSGHYDEQYGFFKSPLEAIL